MLLNIKRVVRKMLVCICGITVNLTAIQHDLSRSISNSRHKQVVSGKQLLVKTKSNLPSIQGKFIPGQFSV